MDLNLTFWETMTTGFLELWPKCSHLTKLFPAGINLNCRSCFGEIPWNQTIEVHGRSTLIDRVITSRWCCITWHWHHRKHVYTKTSVFAAEQIVINEVYVLFQLYIAIAIDYRKKYINFFYSADLTFSINGIIYFNRAEPTCYRTNFLCASSW